jgi:hypothetical protein
VNPPEERGGTKFSSEFYVGTKSGHIGTCFGTKAKTKKPGNDDGSD